MASLAKFVIDRLVSNGIKCAHGVPGDYILKFYKMLSDNIRVVGTTTEAAAGFAADAYARLNGLGCVVVTYGVGGFNLLNSVACAYAEKSPVIVISGAPGMAERENKVLMHHMAGHFDCQKNIFSNVTCAQAILNDPDCAGYEVDRVIAAAKYYKQPVYLEIPRDQVDKSIRYDAYTKGTPSFPDSDKQNLQEAIDEVTTWLASAKNPVIWAGVEVARFDLGKKLIKWAEANGLPVATTILGKSVVNETHPLSLGVYCETIAREELKTFMDSCDCLVMLGVMMTDMNLGFLPLKYQRRNTIHATTSHLKIRNHSFTDVRFADFAEALFKVKVEKRNPCLPPQEPSGFSVECDRKITTEKFFKMVNGYLTPKTVIITDVGDSLFGSLDIKVHDNHRYLADAYYASMGFAVPAAVGAQSASDECRPVVIVGDGAFQMSGQEFSTLVRMGSSAVVFVLNNSGYATERLILDGSFNDVQNWQYEKLPVIYGGGLGFRCTTEGELDQAMAAAFNSKQPSLINVILDSKDQSPTLRRMFKKLAKP